jgi:CBS domain containing-hemolysin-like protein
MARAEEGHSWANKFIDIKDNVDKPLSAILSLNTVAHTIGAAGVGAQAVKVFGEESFGIVSAVLTILILVITEIIPKTIGARFWRNLAPASLRVIQFMIVITYPLVVMSAYITKIFSKKEGEKSTSREEISAMATMGADEGLFNEREHRIIQNLLKLKNVRVETIMTPRVVVTTANENVTLEEFMKKKDLFHFSRIPVFENEKENITGFVMRQNIMESLAKDQHSIKVKELKREITIIPGSMHLFQVWETLLQKKEHIALVVDDFGGFDGIVTMEDIIETLLGFEIMDEKDIVSDMQKYARDRWKSKLEKYKILDNIE